MTDEPGAAERIQTKLDADAVRLGAVERHHLHWPILAFASGLFTGYIPKAPGTFGTALAVALYLPLAPLNTPAQLPVYLAVVAFVCLLGIAASNYAEKVHGGKDPQQVVIDEIVGYFISMTLLPTNGYYLVSAFLLFRVFDIWKPTPIREIQRLKGGVGVMIDDALAGVYACAILHVVRLIMERAG